jgi:malonyl-CoA/methylmalonyl-CoA synthetase
MIEGTLRRLEAAGHRKVVTGLAADGTRIWSQSATELLERVGGWQHVLRQRGVQAGDRVAVDVTRGPELLPAHLAILGAGACVVPVNPALAAAERERVFERAELRCALGDTDAPDGGAAPELAAVDNERPALLIFTSGTTGEPKGVPLSLANLEANLDGLARTWRLSAEDRLLHVLPAHHVHGLVLALYGSARLALPFALLPRFDADVALSALEAERIRVFMGVPTMYHRMLKSPVQADMSSVRVFISGSAPLAPRDFEDFADRFGHQPLERYGLSETMIVTSNPLDGERRPGTVGHALPHTDVRLADDGEILVRGPTVMRGYWRDDATSDEAFDGDWFRTGDLGAHDDAGYWVISGRKKELIIVGGSNVLPGEVERALADVAGVDEVAAAGLADADRGEVVAAFVVAAESSSADELEARLRSAAEERLAPYKRPRHYRFVRELPRNAMGKIDRRALVS